MIAPSTERMIMDINVNPLVLLERNTTQIRKRAKPSAPMDSPTRRDSREMDSAVLQAKQLATPNVVL